MTGSNKSPNNDQPWTILRILRWTKTYLEEKGSDSPRLDAEVMLAHLLSLSRVDLYLNFDRPLQKAELESYRELIKRRAAHEPIAYITNKKEFYGIEFFVDKRVLIPRPETELLVDEALEAVSRLSRQKENDSPVKILDLGTGSGAIIVALAKQLKTSAAFWASDISDEALETARQNAGRILPDIPVNFEKGDLFKPFEGSDVLFDIICANLPYIPSSEFDGMEQDVKDFEPMSALDGGPDGLSRIRQVIKDAQSFLPESGFLLLEIWPDTANIIVEEALDLGWTRARKIKDLAERDRVVILDHGPEIN